MGSNWEIGRGRPRLRWADDLVRYKEKWPSLTDDRGEWRDLAEGYVQQWTDISGVARPSYWVGLTFQSFQIEKDILRYIRGYSTPSSVDIDSATLTYKCFIMKLIVLLTLSTSESVSMSLCRIRHVEWCDRLIGRLSFIQPQCPVKILVYDRSMKGTQQLSLSLHTEIVVLGARGNNYYCW